MRWLAELEVPPRRREEWLSVLRRLEFEVVERNESVLVYFADLDEIDEPAQVSEEQQRRLDLMDAAIELGASVYCPIKYHGLCEPMNDGLKRHVVLGFAESTSQAYSPTQRAGKDSDAAELAKLALEDDIVAEILSWMSMPLTPRVL